MRRFATTSVAVVLLSLTASAIASPATGGAAGAASATCASSNLVVWLPNGNGNGAAGSVYYRLRITNLGGKSCTLSGFPRVMAISSKGTAVGKPASHEPGSIATVLTLEPGGSASFQLRIVEAGNFSPGECHATKAFGLRVSPPGAGGSKVVPFPFETCAKPAQPVLSVGAVKKG